MDENEIDHSFVSQCLCERPNRLIQFGERQVRRTPALRRTAGRRRLAEIHHEEREENKR